MSHIPFPSNDHGALPPQVECDPQKPPWKKLQSSEITPMSFEVQFRNGQTESFAYCDLRGTKLLNAGYVILHVLGMEKYHIIIEGRNLRELVSHIRLGRIHWFQETPNFGYELPEEAPYIERITIDVLTGPY